ncbi:MAG: efflux RND transporter permease subunit [Candidatus Zixiibacteriota bacterium]
MKKISDFAVDNPVLVNLIMIGIIVIGALWALPQMPRELMPNMSLNWAFVVVPYPGVSPEEIEQYITIPLEDEIEGVDRIESLTSTSSEGLSQVSAKFETMSDDDFDKRFQDLESTVNSMGDLPEDAEDPILIDFGTEEFIPMVSVVVSGDIPEPEMKSLAEDLRDIIEDIEGISQAAIYGVRDREILVEVNSSRLEFYNLSLGHIVTALASQNVSIPGGQIDIDREEYLLRTIGQFESIDQIRNVVISSTPDGGIVRLSDVAQATDTFERRRTTSRFNGDVSMTISLSKKPKGNTIALIEEVRKTVDDFRRSLPEGVSLSVTGDTGILIDEVLTALSNNAYFGLVLVIILLTIVMGWRNSLFAAIGIPVSFLATFIFLWLSGESLNGNSLFGLVLVLGVIVDDAIIVIENSYRHMQLGYSPHQAAKIGTAEVVGPVFSATLTTIAAFLPLMFVPGIIGKFMRIVPIVVSLALAASLFEAFVILPSHIAEWSPKKLLRVRKRYTRRIRTFRLRYVRILKFSLKHRYAAISSVVVMFLLAGTFMFIVTGVELFREDEMDVMQVWVTMPPGTRIEATDEVIKKIERLAWKLPEGEVESVIGNAGVMQTDKEWVSRSYVGQLMINLKNKKDRQFTGPELREMMERIIASEVAGIEDITVATISTGPPVGAPIEFKVKGKYFDRLEELAMELQDSLAAVPGVYGIFDDYQPGKRELQVDVDIERSAMLGLDVRTVAAAVGTAFEGAVATVYRDGDEEVDVMVKFDEESRGKVDDIENMKILNRLGSLVTFKDVARLSTKQGLADIHRFNGERAITISAELDKSESTIDAAVAKVAQAFQSVSLKYPGYRIDFGGEFKEFETAFDNITMLFMVGMILIYAILGAQFKSFAQPLIIMFTIPFAFIGAALGLFVTGNPFSITTMYGIVALAGIVVNDSLVLISFVNRRRELGARRLRAIMKGGLIRLRPIVLTSITTIFGLLPMTLGFGGKSLVWSPLANTIVWGLTVATGMTLFIIPALYLIVSDISRYLGLSRFKSDITEKSLLRKPS